MRRSFIRCAMPTPPTVSISATFIRKWWPTYSAGWDKFSGKSKVSTWIWRIAINTCITFYKRHGKHNDADRLDDKAFAIPVDDEHARMLHDMYELIGRLDPIDKALVMLWLDEHSYEEIASVLGLTPTNVGSRLSRIRRKLSDMARE